MAYRECPLLPFLLPLLTPIRFPGRHAPRRSLPPPDALRETEADRAALIFEVSREPLEVDRELGAGGFGLQVDDPDVGIEIRQPDPFKTTRQPLPDPWVQVRLDVVLSIDSVCGLLKTVSSAFFRLFQNDISSLLLPDIRRYFGTGCVTYFGFLTMTLIVGRYRSTEPRLRHH